MRVTCESESLGDAARAAVGSLGPHQSLRGRGALLSSQSLRGNASGNASSPRVEKLERKCVSSAKRVPRGWPTPTL